MDQGAEFSRDSTSARGGGRASYRCRRNSHPGSGVRRSPHDIFGPLFEAVQTRWLFPDGKTFADAIPRRPAEAIIADYQRFARNDEALLAFVLENFSLPSPCLVPRPAVPAAKGLLTHISELWGRLARPPHDVPNGSSELQLSAAYVVPGGRFCEIYYWDSYYTMLGLAQDGRGELVEGLIDNFTDLIERYGHVPNGTRTYYLSRSQPPHYALMADLSVARGKRVGRRRLAAMRDEHAFWMAGAQNLAPGEADRRVVRLHDGALLNRYWDDRDSPRDESMGIDVDTALTSGRPNPIIWRELRAGAESGWDFSSRWLGESGDLGSIRTTQIVPIDLNCLLYASERIIERRCIECDLPNDARYYGELARQRCKAIRRWLWTEGCGRFGDLDLAFQTTTSCVSSAISYALFAGVATNRQAALTARLIGESLMAPGGVRTTLKATGEQWDAPNGWAPLQWVTVMGLRHHGRHALAKTLASRWLRTVQREFEISGRVLEKYNVEALMPGGGGEYPLQDGFGWTNGVTAALAGLYPELHY